jgi:hypothetical protein
MLSCVVIFAHDPRSQGWTENLLSRSFLLSLWWRELAWFAVLICLAVLAMAWIGLRNKASDHAAVNPTPINITKRLKELTEEL